MARSCRVLLAIVLLGITSDTLAIRVQGVVRDAITRLPLCGAVVTWDRGKAGPVRSVTRIDGHYRFEVRSGERAVIRFDHAGLVSRHVVFNATDVPREWTDALEANMDMRLFPLMEGLDSLLLQAPAGTCSWDAAEENMVWDMERSVSLTDRWNALLEEHLQGHPAQRPTDLQRRMAKAFDLASEWAIFVSFALIGVLYLVLKWAIGRLGRSLRFTLLLAVLVGSIALVVDLATAAGPLRFLAFFGLMGALLSGGLLLADLLVGRTALERSNGMDVEPVGEVEPLDEDAGPPSRSRGASWLPMVILFSAFFVLMFEGLHGLENTLTVWSLRGKGAAAGLVAAAVIAWHRSPKVVRAYPRLMLWSGGVWWFALPMLGVASASFLNRSFMEQGEHCHVWPVEEITHSRRNGINVRVSWAGGRERLEMPRDIKEQLTTLDSLRCCTRSGLLGHDFVHRVEPVPAPDDPR